ncbi:hypothetical protein ACLOJK_022381, partial [Asimina triloba]
MSPDEEVDDSAIVDSEHILNDICYECGHQCIFRQRVDQRTAGYTEIRIRSLLSSLENYVTLLLNTGNPIYSLSFAFGMLRRFLLKDKIEGVKGMSITADGRGAVFDVPATDVDLFLAAPQSPVDESLLPTTEKQESGMLGSSTDINEEILSGVVDEKPREVDLVPASKKAEENCTVSGQISIEKGAENGLQEDACGQRARLNGIRYSREETTVKIWQISSLYWRNTTGRNSLDGEEEGLAVVGLIDFLGEEVALLIEEVDFLRVVVAVTMVMGTDLDVGRGREEGKRKIFLLRHRGRRTVVVGAGEGGRDVVDAAVDDTGGGDADDAGLDRRWREERELRSTGVGGGIRRPDESKRDWENGEEEGKWKKKENRKCGTAEGKWEGKRGRVDE